MDFFICILGRYEDLPRVKGMGELYTLYGGPSVCMDKTASSPTVTRGLLQ